MKSQKTSMLILFGSLVTVMLGFGIIIPLMPFYITHFGASGSALGLVMAVYSIMQFIFAPIWGRLSDRWGRKPVLLIGVLGYALVVWATASNAFFSQIVRIQTERGHTVAAGGPYHYVRHPTYLGSILYELAVPILFSSWWSMIPSALNALLLTVRTVLEDRTLQAELPGYADYARRTPRFLPRLWRSR